MRSRSQATAAMRMRCGSAGKATRTLPNASAKWRSRCQVEGSRAASCTARWTRCRKDADGELCGARRSADPHDGRPPRVPPPLHALSHREPRGPRPGAERAAHHPPQAGHRGGLEPFQGNRDVDAVHRPRLQRGLPGRGAARRAHRGPRVREGGARRARGGRLREPARAAHVGRAAAAVRRLQRGAREAPARVLRGRLVREPAGRGRVGRARGRRAAAAPAAGARPNFPRQGRRRGPVLPRPAVVEPRRARGRHDGRGPRDETGTARLPGAARLPRRRRRVAPGRLGRLLRRARRRARVRGRGAAVGLVLRRGALAQGAARGVRVPRAVARRARPRRRDHVRPRPSRPGHALPRRRLGHRGGLRDLQRPVAGTIFERFRLGKRWNIVTVMLGR